MDLAPDSALLELLGSGGCGSVYRVRGRDDADAVVFALKCVPKARLATVQQRERFRAEQQILETLRSPFLCRSPAPPTKRVRVPDELAPDQDEHEMLAMEYIDGRPLYQCVWRYRDGSGRLPERVAKFFAAQIVLAVRALHERGFVHRDLKSGNVLVDRTGFAKVIDFGLAKKLANERERARSFCGTHYVMAPEIFTRSSHGFAIDWWSLGVVIYEMVVGRPPWEYKPAVGQPLVEYFATVSELVDRLQAPGDLALPPSRSASPAPPLSPALQSLLRELLAVDPEQRLGRSGAREVMEHPWFEDVDWELLEAKEIAVPYNPHTDFLADAAPAAVPTSPADDLSSAESIDPEDDAKYFADF